MEQEIIAQKPIFKRFWWIGLIVIILFGAVGYRQLTKDSRAEKLDKKAENTPPKSVVIPDSILNNKFGWLGGDGDGARIKSAGGAWGRPHLGSFVWDEMQKGPNEPVSFFATDAEISSLEESNLGALVTIWPFAEWDQEKRSNTSACAVQNNDEFLTAKGKGNRNYLPLHRCNPNDWTAYQKWVASLVERYDGDGKDDMPGLQIPVKYWEVSNEPDLQWNNTHPPQNEERSLNFYKQQPSDYAELLIITNQAIKAADQDAQVLIAGAAGGEDRMLNFYREVFKNTDAIVSFDIANVHCISSPNVTDFNVKAYKKMLTDLNINKPIWITEAESLSGKDADENFQNTKTSVQNALALGVQRIFFTQSNFSPFVPGQPPATGNHTYKEIIDGLQK